ncbi:MAG: ABC transporter ATP-binding protein [Acidobacteriota bacterium]
MNGAASPTVELRDVTKRFGDVTAVDSVTLAIARGELLSLLGPSGCGKTTLLRILGGFEAPTSGRVFLSGRDVTALAPNDRAVNTVFQHYALFPHLSVRDNVAFGLPYARIPRDAHDAKVKDALALVRLDGYERRFPRELSGGQRQRVALARALVLAPEVLLLDEPLGALDRKLRKEMQVELRALQRRLGITFVLVTHDQEEALAMSDRIAVMNAGRIEQVDGAAAVFERPRTLFAARFLGAANIVPGEGGRPAIVRPERARLAGDEPAAGALAAIGCVVDERVYQGASTLFIVRSDAGQDLEALEPGGAPFGPAEALAPGRRVFFCYRREDAVTLAGEASP